MFMSNRKNKIVYFLTFLFLFMTPPFSLEKVYASAEKTVLNAFDLAEIGKCDEAMDMIDEILRKNPEKCQAYLVKGYIYQGNENFELAIRAYTTTIDLDCNDEFAVLAYSGRGNIWKKRMVLHKAIYDFTKILELDPDNVLAYSDRASVWIIMKEYKAAINDYTSIISIKPDDIHVYAQRAEMFLKKGMWNYALSDVQRIIELENSKELKQ